MYRCLRRESNPHTKPDLDPTIRGDKDNRKQQQFLNDEDTNMGVVRSISSQAQKQQKYPILHVRWYHHHSDGLHHQESPTVSTINYIFSDTLSSRFSIWRELFFPMLRHFYLLCTQQSASTE